MKPRQLAASAFWALRAYRGSTVLLVACCAAGLAAALPVAALMRFSGAGIAPTIGLAPGPNVDFALAWSQYAQDPTALGGEALTALLNLLAGVAVGVLAVAGLTILSVSTARADAREMEIGVRRAVGASRRVLVATLLLEGSCVLAVGAALGYAVGLVAAHLVLATWPGSVGALALTPSLLAGAVSLGAIMLGALFPLIFARRSSQIAVAESTPVGLAIPAAQLGLSLTVLAMASLLKGGAMRGAEPETRRPEQSRVYEITTADPEPASRAATYAALLQRLKGDRAVAAASLGNPGGVAGMGVADIAWTDFRDCTPGTWILPLKYCRVTYYVASADTFLTSGLQVVAGRALSDSDDLRASRVVVISRSLAPPQDPAAALGRTVLVGHGVPTPYTVVGVVDDRQPAGLGSGFQPPFAVYLSVLQHPAAPAELLVRARGDSQAADRTVRGAIAMSVSPLGRTATASTAAAVLAKAAAPLRWFEQIFALEGWALLAIATIGVFAMMWLWVSSLVGEVGIRRAVGARRVRIMVYVLSRALVMAVAGVVFGAWLGMMLWDAVRGIVSGLPPWEPGAVGRLAVVLAVAALAGAWLPAYRATRAQPTRLLSP